MKLLITKNGLELIFNTLKENNISLTEKLIKKVNEIINKDTKDSIGYRKVQVFIQGSEHIPPKPEKIINLMQYFIYNYNNDINDIYTRIAKYHIEFEKIHPFEDGNGRTGRLLINYELLKNNLPPVVISKDDRIKYFEFLKNTDIIGFSNWLKELSEQENERISNFK